MMVLALVTLVARSVIAFAADSTFLYFLQPSARWDRAGRSRSSDRWCSIRPLVRRFAADFADAARPTCSARPSVHRCFRQLSLLWGTYGLANAALGPAGCSPSLSTPAYVVLRTPLSIVGTAAMVALVDGPVPPDGRRAPRSTARAEPRARTRRRPGRAGLGPGRACGVAGTGVDPVTPRFSGACSAD